MAERNERFEALILRAKETPQGTRVVSILGGEAGLLDAFVFGGAKGGLRSSATPYVYATLAVYHDPVKNYRKVTDIQVLESFSGLRTGYGKLMCAGAVAETILKTHAAGGEYSRSLALALDALRRMEGRADEDSLLILLAFLWETLSLLGLDPDIGSCSGCGRPLPRDPRSQGFRLSRQMPGLACPSCDPEGRAFPTAMLETLDELKRRGMGACDSLALSDQGYRDLFDLVRGLARHATEDSLLSLSNGNFSSFFPGDF